MMSSLPEIFDKDKNMYILTISDLEMFLATYKYDRQKFEGIINDLISNDLKGESFFSILDRHGGIGNLHFIEERNYFSIILAGMRRDNID